MEVLNDLSQMTAESIVLHIGLKPTCETLYRTRHDSIGWCVGRVEEIIVLSV